MFEMLIMLSGWRKINNKSLGTKECQGFEEPGKQNCHLGTYENTRCNGKSSNEERDSKSRVSDKPIN